MKKFIVFCLILIVTVSLGVTVFYFMRDNEELVVNAEPYIYANKGDLLEIDVTLKHAKVGNEVIMTSLTESVLEWNPALNGFEAIEGGAGVIEIKTKNAKIPAVHIQVNVGNGMKEAPFFIDSEEDLLGIGTNGIYELSHNYILQQDISLTSNFTPIAKGSLSGFTGTLNGNGYAIRNLTIADTAGVTDAGLFAKIGSTGIVTNLILTDVNVNGQFENAGAIAGVNLGTINRSEVIGGSVTSTLANSNVGGVAGVVEFSNSNVGRIDRTVASVSVSGTLNLGGLVGVNKGAIIVNSYVILDDNNVITVLADGAIAGGIVGLNVDLNNKVSTMKNCYVKGGNIIIAQGLDDTTIKLASIIGFNDESSNSTSNNLMGLYTDNTLLTAANHEFNLTFTEAEKAKEINFRGIYTSFPKDASDKIIASELISYIPSDASSNADYVSWDFANVWMLDSSVNNGYPILNKLGADVPDDIALVYDPSRISTAEDLINLASAVQNGTASNYYKLENDITLTGDFTPIGTNARPFNGIFEGNGHIIKGLNISSSVIDSLGESKNKLVGLFGKISSSATIRNLILDGVTIADGATYAGALVGYSEGTIQNITITQTALNAETDNISATYAVGGIAGISLGLIENCKVANQTIAVKAISKNSSRYAGGIAGLNGQENSSATAIIRNSSVVTSYVYDNEQNTDFPSNFKFKFRDTLTKAIYFVGGIAGANYYQVTQNYVYKTDLEIDEYSEKGVVAGIAGLSKGIALLNEGIAEVSYNKVLDGTIKGFVAGGLVSYLYGIAQFNHVEVNTIYGLLVSGLTNDIKINGRLNNCFSKSHLVNSYSWGGSAGMTNYVRYYVENRIVGFEVSYYGEFKTCFSACTFESTNEYSRYDSNADYRNESNFIYTVRYDGYGNNLIWVETGHATYDKSVFLGDSRIHDIYGISNEEAKLMVNEQTTITLFTKNGFSTEYWSFDTMSYPTILNLPEISEIA